MTTHSAALDDYIFACAERHTSKSFMSGIIDWGSTIPGQGTDVRLQNCYLDWEWFIITILKEIKTHRTHLLKNQQWYINNDPQLLYTFIRQYFLSGRLMKYLIDVSNVSHRTYKHRATAVKDRLIALFNGAAALDELSKCEPQTSTKKPRSAGGKKASAKGKTRKCSKKKTSKRRRRCL